MKTTLIRILTIMTLATSLSAFAMSEAANGAPKKTNPKETTVSMPSIDEPQSQQGKDKDNDKSRKQQIEEQYKEWLHNLQGVYGG